MSCGIVILAAGSSSRLGRPKQLLAYQGKSLLRRAAETALKTSCRPVIVVLGSNSAEMANEISNLPIDVRTNSHWEKGIGSSIKIGVKAVADARCDAVALLLCDQPLVKASAIDDLVRRRHESGKLICAASYCGTFGTPAVFAASLFDQLLNLTDSEGGKSIIARHAADIESALLPEAALDVDTEADFNKLSGG